MTNTYVKPGSDLGQPADVLDSDHLSKEQKIEMLRQWEYDALQLQVATEENMAAPARVARPELADIRAALEALGEPGPSKS